MFIFPNIGYDGSNFNVEKEFSDIINKGVYKKVFITDVSEVNLIMFKFNLTEPPRKTECPDENKIKDLMNKLKENNFKVEEPRLLNLDGKHHYLYVF